MAPRTGPSYSCENLRRRTSPRGLWKARALSRFSADNSGHDTNSQSFSTCEPVLNEPFGSPSTTTTQDLLRNDLKYPQNVGDEDEVEYFLDPPGKLKREWTAHLNLKTIDMYSFSRGADMETQGPRFDLSEWEDLKTLFNKATEMYEEEPVEALPTLRAVLRECQRFLKIYDDPSVFFAPPDDNSDAPSVVKDKPSEKAYQSQFSSSSGRRRWSGSELPTSFHSILGSALYYMGNIIDHDPSLVADGEPNSAICYWAYALDAFETGETLPCRINNASFEIPEDWSMAMFWGRTYVSLAELCAETSKKAKQSGAVYVSPLASFASMEPKWPEDSPFRIISSRRPSITRRMSLSTASAHELMVLARDLFSRAIFHMPHLKRSSPLLSQGATPPSESMSEDKSVSSYVSEKIAGAPSCHPRLFSRARELFSIAYDVLVLSDKFEKPEDRQKWSSYADIVFEQMKVGDSEAWRGPINIARGRCWLIFGSAAAVMLDPALERGDLGVLESEDAEDARDALEKAVGYCERVIGTRIDGLTSEEETNLKKMYVESLVTLANMTPDEARREKLYAKVEAEGSRLDVEMDLDSDGDQVMD